MIIAVDFDGTIVSHKYPDIGKPIPFAIEALKMLQKEHHQIILWTVREGTFLEDAVEYCRKQGLEFYAVNVSSPDEKNRIHQYSRKIKADLFIDDSNFGGLPDWGVIYHLIKTGKFHNECVRYNMKEYCSQRKCWWFKSFILFIFHSFS